MDISLSRTVSARSLISAPACSPVGGAVETRAIREDEEAKSQPELCGTRARRAIALLGNYAPRQCGIATFTQDLRAAMLLRAPDLEVPVAMVSDDPEGYACPEEVRCVIDQSSRADHVMSARWINQAEVEAVCVQHEFGIYGGPSGAWLLDILRRLRIPIITTCHTVLRQPSREQQQIMRELSRCSARVVVMTEKGRDLLQEIYAVPGSKIAVISHGIPDVVFSAEECRRAREELAWDGQKIILSFGLLSPNKGIEYAIRALPDIAETHPDVKYVVVGATHPNLLRSEGERYRESLLTLARELGVSDKLQFIERFVPRDELVRLIAAADIYTTPYLNEEQITSGTLAYAFGLGKPVVSTPYWHACELLANQAGMIVPFRDETALASALRQLLSDDEQRQKISRLAGERGRSMRWSHVGREYLDEIDAAVHERRQAASNGVRHSEAA